MRSVLMQWRNKFELVMDVFAAGLAVDTGRLTAAQATSAIARAGHRSDLRELDIDGLSNDGLVGHRDEELVDAR